MNDFHLFSRKDSVKQILSTITWEWGMLGWVFVCDLMGKEKHNWVDQLCLVALAEGMNGLMVHGLKNWVNEPRPDGAPYSFPSGHTSNAFLGAHMAANLRYRPYSLTPAAIAGVRGGPAITGNGWHGCSSRRGFRDLVGRVIVSDLFPIRNAIARRINRRGRTA